MAAILGLVLVGTRWRDLWALLARRAVRAALLVVVAAAAVAQVYIHVAHTITLIAGLPVTLADAAIWRVSAGHSGLWLHQMIAQLGWQTPTPLLAVVARIAAVGCVLLIGAAAAGVRMRLAIVATTVATAVLPIVAEATTARQSGFIWQGRYLLPIAVGVPLLAGFALARHSGDGADARRLAGAVSSVVGVGSLAAFYAALRRHMVGVDGPLNPLTPLPASWQPPVPATLLVLASCCSPWRSAAGSLTWPALRRDSSMASAAARRSRAPREIAGLDCHVSADGQAEVWLGPREAAQSRRPRTLRARPTRRWSMHLRGKPLP